MGWDQSFSLEGSGAFLCRHLGIDVNQLIQSAIDLALATRGLTYSIDPVAGDPDDYMGPSELEKITFSDGTEFVHKVVARDVGDDWGHDDYKFFPVNEEPVVKTTCCHD